MLRFVFILSAVRLPIVVEQEEDDMPVLDDISLKEFMRTLLDSRSYKTNEWIAM